MKQTNLYFLIEILWWAVTGVVVLAVLWPIWNAGISWPFQTVNIVFIATLITFGRHIFALNYSLIGKHQITKVVIMIAMVPVLFVMISYLNGFMVYIEEETWEKITGQLAPASRHSLESYIWNEMLFFSVGSIIAAIVLAARLFSSIWQQYNAEKHKVYQH